MMDEIPAIMTIEDAAKYLGVNPLTLRRLARAGRDTDVQDRQAMAGQERTA